MYKRSILNRVPKKKDDGPGFKHVSVVRKHDERKKLSASACRECENVNSGVDRKGINE